MSRTAGSSQAPLVPSAVIVARSAQAIHTTVLNVGLIELSTQLEEPATRQHTTTTYLSLPPEQLFRAPVATPAKIPPPGARHAIMDTMVPTIMLPQEKCRWSASLAVPVSLKACTSATWTGASSAMRAARAVPRIRRSARHAPRVCTCRQRTTTA